MGTSLRVLMINCEAIHIPLTFGNPYVGTQMQNLALSSLSLNFEIDESVKVKQFTRETFEDLG